MTSNGRFLEDVTIPDDTPIELGVAFTKSWRVENSGDAAWGPDFHLVFTRGTMMTGSVRQPLPEIAPGETAVLSLPMTAPTRPGAFFSEFRLQDGDGRFFGELLFVRIQAISPETPAKSNGRYLADITIPDGSKLKTGETFTKTWLVENNGDTAWGEGFKLVHIGGDPMGQTTNFSLPAAVPGQRVNISIPMTAPTQMWRVISRWRMQDERGRFFGQHLYVDVFVVEDSQPPTPGEFDPAAWRNTIWAITSIFESGRPEGNPAAYQTFDAGIISYGKHQATLASGTLNRVALAYFERSDSPTSQTLQAEYAARIAQGDASLRHDARLKELLLAAAEEPAMMEAQDVVFDDRFYQPAVNQAKAHNLRTPLALACLYDTQIQGGLFILLPRAVERLGGIVGEAGTDGLIDEAAFITAFLDEREARLLRLADQFEANGNTANARALRISTFRVKEYRKLLQAGNLALAGTLNIRGQTVAGVA